MRKPGVIAIVGLLSLAAWGQAAAAQSEDPNDMFGGSTVTEAAPAASGSQESLGPERLLETKGIEIGGTLFSDFASYAFWPGAYPVLADPGSGLSTSFVPTLEGDLYFDARPYTYFRVFGKLKAVYPFSAAAQGGAPAQANAPGAAYEPAAPAASIPNLSVFELIADVNWNQSVFLRVGQQTINWGVGRFFSPADILSLTPINPLQPTLQRQGPLALTVTVPFAGVDSAYLYVIANQAFAQGGAAFQPADLAVAPKVEVLLGDFEIGLGGYYQRNQRPKAMTTVSGSLFGLFGVFGEGVVSYGSDRVLVGAGGPYTDTTTPYFSGTVGASYVEGQQHVAVFVQYYYNGQGYADLAGEKAAGAAYGAQQAVLGSGGTPTGPLLSPSDLMLPGRHYLAASVAWTDIRASNVDLGLFYEGNLGDGSGVVSPYVSYTPFPYCTLTVAPYVAYGASGSELVGQFGYFALSFKLTVGEGDF